MSFRLFFFFVQSICSILREEFKKKGFQIHRDIFWVLRYTFVDRISCVMTTLEGCCGLPMVTNMVNQLLTMGLLHIRRMSGSVAEPTMTDNQAAC